MLMKQEKTVWAGLAVEMRDWSGWSVVFCVTNFLGQGKYAEQNWWKRCQLPTQNKNAWADWNPATFSLHPKTADKSACGDQSGQHCLFYGWAHRSVKGRHMCIYSILIRALHLISSYLGCIIYFCYLPRMSTWDGKLADRLSIESTTSTEDKKLLNSFPLIQNVELLWKMAAESRRGFLFSWVSAGRY